MPNLPESSASYPASVRQIDSGEIAVGGDTSKPPNEQLLALASRTAYLKVQLDAVQAAIAGLTIGTDVQAHSTNLDAIAGLNLVADKLLGTNGAGAAALLNKVSVAILQDYKSGFGGTGSTGTWMKRDLNNKEEAGESFCTLNADSTFDLPAGSYAVIARVPGTMVDKHQARLNNTTDNSFFKGSSTQTLHGSAVSGQSLTTDSWVFAAFAIAATKKFQIEHRIFDTLTDRSLGAEVSTGLGEVYTQVFVLKLS